MQLVFGQSVDGRCFPDFAGGGQGSVTTHVVGPNGLVDMLEIQLGLTGRMVPPVARVAAFQAKLEDLDGDRFWSRSFAADAWATAKLLLTWRDALVMGGWRADKSTAAQKRIRDLRDLELRGAPTPVGLGDRLWAIIGRLAAGDPIGITTVELIDARVHLAPGIRHLVDTLERRGVRVIQRSLPAETRNGDLGTLQSVLVAPADTTLRGDGSVVDLVAQTELMMAEAVADWLLAIGPEGRASTLVLAEGGSTALLDSALTQRGLAKLGLSSASALRGALQILPLAIGLQWRPLDPGILLDLLMLPRPPIAPFAASILATALSREPGLGGREWQAAWKRIEQILAKSAAARERQQEESTSQLQAWRTWTSGGHFDPQDGMPKAEAKAVVDLVIKWAVETDRGGKDPLLMAVVGAGRALREALEASPRQRFPRLLMEAMTAQAIGDGVSDPEHIPEAGEVRAVARAGAVWDKAERIVWFDFKDPGVAAPPSPWDEEERDVLEAEGCRIETASETAARISAEWARALRMADKQVMFARVQEGDGSAVGTHPLAHRLTPVLGARTAASRIRFKAEDLLGRASVRIGDTELVRQAGKVVQLPAPAKTWPVSAATISRIGERVETATTLEHLLRCPLQWLLSDVLGIRAGRAHSIPRPETLLGNVAHELAQRLFPPGDPPDPGIVRQRVLEVIEEVAEAIAAPLLQPGAARDMAHARRRIPDSLVFLAEQLSERGLKVKGTEVEFEAELATGIKTRGRIDMVAELPKGKPAVIDFKWSSRDSYRREELAEGRAIQLAVYGRAVNGKRGVAPGGYYMLAQRKLLAEEGSPLATETVAVARDLAETVAAITEARRTWHTSIAQGTVRAAGIAPGEDLPDKLDVILKEPCRFCEFTGLCRVPVGRSA